MGGVCIYVMQVCGARGGGDAAAQGLFLALSPALVFMLACEASRERNAAIMLIRRFAQEVGINLGGPDDAPQPPPQLRVTSS